MGRGHNRGLVLSLGLSARLVKTSWLAGRCNQAARQAASGQTSGHLSLAGPPSAGNVFSLRPVPKPNQAQLP